jgi:magnesium transporter
MSTSDHDTERVQERLEALTHAGDVTAASELASELHPSDLADLVEGLDDDDQVALLHALPTELASETLVEMEGGEDRADLLTALSPERGAELLHELPDDDAADLIGELEPAEQHRLLEALPVDEAGELRGLLQYHEETAGGLMTTDLVSVEASQTARQALEKVRVRGREVEDFYTVFVVDAEDRLVGTLRLDDLVIADPAESIEALVEEPIATVLPDVDQERVGRLLSRYNLVAIPVVDERGVLLGRITFDDVIDVIEAEQTEDILRLAGIGNQEALRLSWWETVRSRLPWLLLNLATAMLAAFVVYIFSDTIENAVILAAIMPVIAGMGGNAGTQALAVTVRGIAIEGSPRRRSEVVVREVVVGVVNGAVLGVAVAGLAVWLGGDPRLGWVVLAAMWANLVVAGFAGSMVPTVLYRMGVDPAVASSVFVTTLTDLCGFFFLLGLASAVLL